MGRITLLVDGKQFQAGLYAGLVGLLAVFLVTTSKVLGRRPAVAGLAFAGASVAALQGLGRWPPAHSIDSSVLVAIVVLGVGGVGIQVLRDSRSLLGSAVMLVPGSVLMGLALTDIGPRWAALAAVILIPLAGALAADCDDFHRRYAFGPALLAITVLGVYATVPDTEGARALVGAAVPLVLYSLPRAIATLGAAGIAASLGIVVFIAVSEGAGRPGSIVGAFGCLGFLVVEPVGRRVAAKVRDRKIRSAHDTLAGALLAFALQVVVVGYASRVAGLEREPLTALVLLSIGLVAAAVAAACLPELAVADSRKQVRG